ncbi:MAG TPA: class II aldolase/adducin family protein [Bacteroidales bacterium]|nr:class II aldolase/adducin family protein [Bacteroidales bacterium]
MKYREERREVARFMRRLYRHGLTTTSGGNISLRLDDDIVLITPSATDKGRMKGSEVGIMTLDGKNLTPSLKPSIETGMHLSVYRRRDVKAIVHAHPVFATSFTAMKRKINTSLTAEACAIIREPVLVPYTLMGSPGLAENVSALADESDLLLLENHGILAVGTNLLQAFDRIEVLENAARMTFIVEMMGRKSPLTTARAEEIRRLFR